MCLYEDMGNSAAAFASECVDFELLVVVEGNDYWDKLMQQVIVPRDCFYILLLGKNIGPVLIVCFHWMVVTFQAIAMERLPFDFVQVECGLDNIAGRLHKAIQRFHSVELDVRKGSTVANLSQHCCYHLSDRQKLEMEVGLPKVHDS